MLLNCGVGEDKSILREIGPGCSLEGLLLNLKLQYFVYLMQRTEKVRVTSLSRVRLLVTPWTVAYQALTSMGFSRQEYWSGLPFHSPGDLPASGIGPGSPTL